MCIRDRNEEVVLSCEFTKVGERVYSCISVYDVCMISEGFSGSVYETFLDNGDSVVGMNLGVVQ